ncbi:MAG TPA: hypothetical protein VHS57_01755 [Acidimicrobiales bacterium]|nr:hypothetical protein [Acidimicrobiales bacterium]
MTQTTEDVTTAEPAGQPVGLESGAHRLSRWRPTRVGVFVALAIGSYVLVDLAWVVAQRDGQPMDIDEAGYIGISLRDYHGLQGSGLSGWWHEIVTQTVQAPLAPALASLMHWTTGARVLNAYLVSVLSFGALLFAAFGLTRSWPTRWRVLSLVVTAASPILVLYSRSFIFAELASACLASALYFAARSRCFSRLGPALAWGASIALMVLSRTMTLAFVPGLIVAALLLVAATRSLRSLLNVGAGLVVGALLAATWYVHNWSNVYAYLNGFGYGAQAGSYGPQRSLFSVHDWYDFIVSMTNTYLSAGFTLYVILGWVAALALAVIGLVRAPRTTPGPMTRARWARLQAERAPEVITAAIVASFGTAALLSSRNQGNAFIAPLVVPLVLVATSGFKALFAAIRASDAQRMRSVGRPIALGLMVLASGLVVVSGLVVFLPQTIHVSATVPVSSTLRIGLWNSDSAMELYEAAGHVPASVDPAPNSSGTGRAWLAAWGSVDSAIRAQEHGRPNPPVVVLTFRDELLNTNTIAMESLLRDEVEPVQYQFTPTAGHDSGRYILSRVQPLDPSVRVVITATAGPDDIPPALPENIGLEYVRSLHFAEASSHRLPDGRTVTIWVRR